MAKSKASPANAVSIREDDLRTCLQYKEIMKDPKRKAAMKKLAAEKLKDLQAIKEK